MLCPVPVLAPNFTGNRRAVSSRAEVTTVVCLADTAGNRHGHYFRISSASQRVAVQFTNGGLLMPPFGAGRTIVVSFVNGDSAATLATLLAAALTSDGAWSAVAVVDTVTITDALQGSRTDAANVDLGFAVSVTTQGR